jgi:hypothetical protein
MKQLIVFVFVAFVFALPQTARADSPQPDVQTWMYAAAEYSGLGTIQAVQAAFGNFQNDQARVHNYNTPEKWQSNYASDVSIFLRLHGCASCNIDGVAQSFKLKVDEPTFMRDFDRNFPQ